MGLCVLPPDEAKRKARANVAAWKREKLLRSRLAGKGETEPAMGSNGAIDKETILRRLPSREILIKAIIKKPGAKEFLRSDEGKPANDALRKMFSRLDALRQKLEIDGGIEVSEAEEEIKTLKLSLVAITDRIAERLALNAELCEAAEKGDDDGVKRLLDAGADIEARDPKLGETPLMKAVKDKFRLSTATLLIQRGADVNAKDRSGNSVYDMAVMKDGHSLMTDLLLENGAKR